MNSQKFVSDFNKEVTPETVFVFTLFPWYPFNNFFLLSLCGICRHLPPSVWGQTVKATSYQVLNGFANNSSVSEPLICPSTDAGEQSFLGFFGFFFGVVVTQHKVTKQSVERRKGCKELVVTIDIQQWMFIQTTAYDIHFAHVYLCAFSTNG